MDIRGTAAADATRAGAVIRNGNLSSLASGGHTIAGPRIGGVEIAPLLAQRKATHA